jgi:spore coat protein H
MRESTQWILNAAYIDRSLMRHKLSYDLFSSMSGTAGKRFAVASRFVELNLNGKYHGVYLLMERVDRQLLGLSAFTSNEVQHAVIYKADDHVTTFSNGGHGGFEQQEPDPLIFKYWKPLDEFTDFVSSANDREFFDSKSGIATRLDLENTIDFHLLILLTSNMDGDDKNFILAKNNRVAGTFEKFFFVPWDYDATFGRNWNARPVAFDEWLSNDLYDRLLRDPKYRRQFVTRWRELRKKEFSTGKILEMMDENARTLGEAAARNAVRWNKPGYYPDKLSFEQDVREMKKWVASRNEFLDKRLARFAE